jgi:hypothetical protein
MQAHVSPEVKLFLAESAPDQALFLIGLKHPATADDRQRIESFGCIVRGVVGDVMTVACSRAALNRLIGWDGVRAVELSAPLHPEGR